MQNPILLWSVRIAICLSLVVVMLGAYTRLTDAGLGCPDWPGCYGRMVVPNTQEHLLKAQAQYPKIPVESRKAWTEMIHRYAAGSLALLILFIGFFTIIQWVKYKTTPWHLPILLILLVIFQAMLGMWTVTLKLLPIVVMGHLLGGMLIFSLLCCFYFQINHSSKELLPFSLLPRQGKKVPEGRMRGSCSDVLFYRLSHCDYEAKTENLPQFRSWLKLGW